MLISLQARKSTSNIFHFHIYSATGFYWYKKSQFIGKEIWRVEWGREMRLWITRCSFNLTFPNWVTSLGILDYFLRHVFGLSINFSFWFLFCKTENEFYLFISTFFIQGSSFSVRTLLFQEALWHTCTEYKLLTISQELYNNTIIIQENGSEKLEIKSMNSGFYKCSRFEFT